MLRIESEESSPGCFTLAFSITIYLDLFDGTLFACKFLAYREGHIVNKVIYHTCTQVSNRMKLLPLSGLVFYVQSVKLAEKSRLSAYLLEPYGGFVQKGDAVCFGRC